MMAKLQRFGGAMFAPVLLFIFPGIVVALATVFTNPDIVGSIAKEGTMWSNIWAVIETGGWTVFNHMEVLFVIGLPLGLATHARGRAAMESFVIYLTFNYFISAILAIFGSNFGVDFNQEAGGQSGMKLIAGIKTLDTGVLGAILVSALAIWLHNRYFDKSLPEFIGIFQGSAMVVMIGFFVMLPVAFATSVVWPIVQQGIMSLQTLMVKSGNFGVFSYIFLEKALLPTGLHHFIYTPFQYGPAVVEGGTTLYWIEHMQEFARSSASLKSLFPEGGFAMQGISNLFGIPGIAMAFYATSKPENRKKVLALLIPGVLTAVFAGITEPFDYTFLFIAPALFFVHAFLAATMATTMYIFGVVGDMQGGLIEMIAKNWFPMGANHWQTYLIQVVIGLFFTGIYFVVFRYLILKFDFKTPGRELATEDVGLYTKADFKAKKQRQQSSNDLSNRGKAINFLEGLGGYQNIEAVTNCASRLRVTVRDDSLVASDEQFKNFGAHGVVRNGLAIQVIVGLSVEQIREEFDKALKEALELDC